MAKDPPRSEPTAHVKWWRDEIEPATEAWETYESIAKRLGKSSGYVRMLAQGRRPRPGGRIVSAMKQRLVSTLSTVRIGSDTQVAGKPRNSVQGSLGESPMGGVGSSPGAHASPEGGEPTEPKGGSPMTETTRLRELLATVAGQIDDEAQLQEIVEFAFGVRIGKSGPHRTLRRPGRGPSG